MVETKVVWGPSTPWKNSVEFFTFLRGSLRRVWSKHPAKLNLVKRVRKQIPNPTGKGKAFVWGFECAVCHKDFTVKEGQVDHIVAAGSLTKISDIQGFVERLLYVNENDLRLVCKLCNSTLAYAERTGLSHEDASIEKQAIIICKGTANEVKSWITQRGEVPARLVKERREQVTRLLKEGR